MPRIPLPDGLRGAPFTTAEGLAAGLGRKRMRGRDLSRPFHGIRTVEPKTATGSVTTTVSATATATATIEELALAFQSGAPPHSYVCGITAAVILGIPLPFRHEQSRLLHVAVPPPNRSPKGRGTVGHKMQVDTEELWVRNGIRMTTAERTWCDLASVLSVPDLVAAGDYLIHWELPLTNRDALRNAVKSWAGRTGVARLRKAVELLSERSESRRESLLRVILVRARIHGIEANVWIRTSGGYRYRGDLVIRDRKVIIEYQSRFHDATKEFAADMTRISRLEADGWYVLQINNGDLSDPVELVARVQRVLAGRPLIR